MGCGRWGGWTRSALGFGEARAPGRAGAWKQVVAAVRPTSAVRGHLRNLRVRDHLLPAAGGAKRVRRRPGPGDLFRLRAPPDPRQGDVSGDGAGPPRRPCRLSRRRFGTVAPGLVGRRRDGTRGGTPLPAARARRLGDLQSRVPWFRLRAVG